MRRSLFHQPLLLPSVALALAATALPLVQPSSLAALQATEPEVIEALRQANLTYSALRNRTISELQSGDLDTIKQALTRVIRLNDPEINPTLRSLLDEDVHDPEIVIAVLHALPNLTGIPGSAEARLLLESDHEGVRLAAYSTLNQQAELRIADAELFAEASLPIIEGSSITKLSDLGDNANQAEQAGDILARTLSFDTDDIDRRMAAIGLGRLGDANYANALIDALSDRDPLVRRYAAESLALLDHKPAIAYLLVAMEAGIAGGDMRQALRSLTGGEDFGYNPHDGLIQRRAAVDRGIRWLSQQNFPK